MAKTDPHPHRQHARLHVRFGKGAALKLEWSVTDRGLVAVGALVSSILLSAAVIARAARPPVSDPPGTAPRIPDGS